jgi:hypothetical protein
MYVLIFSKSFFRNISQEEEKEAGCDQKHILVFMQNTGYFCPTLTKLELFRQIFEKYSNTKFHENPSSGSQVVPCGHMDGRTDGETRGS